jgi:hypothetical protein
MRCARMASTSLLTFGCILLTLFLHAPPSKSGSNLIQIWIVGSPHTGALPSAIVPPDLRRRAESLGYTITVQSFQANGFTARFREALLLHEEPEILTFDNFGVISGIQTPNGWIEGVDSDRRLASSLALGHSLSYLTTFRLQIIQSWSKASSPETSSRLMNDALR